MVDVETAGLVTGIGSFGLGLTEWLLPNATGINVTGTMSVNVIGLMAGFTVWWRARQRRRRNEDR
jgi:hypothetical protein